MKTSFYAAVLALGTITDCAFLNEPRDLRTTVCNGERLAGQCNKNEKLIISSIVAGLKEQNECNQSVSGRKDCCTLDENRDCITSINDTKLYRACTGRTGCDMAPTVNKTMQCRNTSFPNGLPSFYSMKYICIANSRFGDCSSSVLRSCNSGQNLYLMSPGYPNDVSGSMSCECSINSDCNESIRVMTVDINISKREYILYNDSLSSLYDTDRDNKFIISDQYISKTKTILFKANLVNGRFLVAIKAGCSLTIRCPKNQQRAANKCDDSSDDFPMWWIAVVLAIVFCLGAILAYRFYKKKKNSKFLCTAFSKVRDDCYAGSPGKDKNANINMINNGSRQSIFMSLGEGECKNVPPVMGTIHVNTHRLPPISHDELSEKEKGTRCVTEKKKSKRRKKKQKIDPEEESAIKNSDKSEIEETLDFFTSDIIDMTNNSSSIPVI